MPSSFDFSTALTDEAAPHPRGQALLARSPRLRAQLEHAAREETDRKAIRQALARTENNISKAAKLLGISRPTLYDLLKQYDLTA